MTRNKNIIDSFDDTLTNNDDITDELDTNETEGTDLGVKDSILDDNNTNTLVEGMGIVENTEVEDTNVGGDEMDSNTNKKEYTTNQKFYKDINNVELTNEETLVLDAKLRRVEKSLAVEYLLVLFVGIFGLHRFYLNKNETGLAMLLLTVVGFLTQIIGIGFLLLGIVYVWNFIDIFLAYGYVTKYNNDLERQIREDILNKRN